MPRFYVEHPFEEPGVFISDADTTALVAKVHESNPLEVQLGRILPTEKNAELLAAAPELLEALRDLLAFAEQYSEKMRSVGCHSEHLGEHCSPNSVGGVARALIDRLT